MPDPFVLTVNTGSSSLKAAAYGIAGPNDCVWQFSVEHSDDQKQALTRAIADFSSQRNMGQVAMVGHRIVHGGSKYFASCVIDDAVFAGLSQLTMLAPDHLPQAISAIGFFRDAYPELRQMAAFDTTFHRSMPVVSRNYAIPAKFAAQGVYRYGFHGLSYQSILHSLAGLEPQLINARIVVAHLGSGASMAAIDHGVCVDTSMGFAPDSGLVMATRAGDVDAAAVLHLIEHLGLTVADVRELLNAKAGLLAMSENTGDMAELMKFEGEDALAKQAIAMFCYRARKFLGGYAAILGGLDLLVFTGGIGENAAAIRAEICKDLEFLGIELSTQANLAASPVISEAHSRVKVRIVATDENRVIAHEALKLL